MVPLLLSGLAGVLSTRKGLGGIRHRTRALPALECKASRKRCAWPPGLAPCATVSSISPSISKLLDLLRERVPQTNRRPQSSSMQPARTTRTRQPQHATAMRSQFELTGDATADAHLNHGRRNFRASGDHGAVGDGKGRIKTAQLHGLRLSKTLNNFATCVA